MIRNLSLDISIIKSKKISDQYLTSEKKMIQNILKEISSKKNMKLSKSISQNSNILKNLKSTHSEILYKEGFLEIYEKNHFFKTHFWKVK